jgi:glycerophosphoryl diester phosphodiesterase
VHMSQDGVVVLCHDAVLKRLYGVDANVTSLPWEGGLDQLRTVREPHSPMLTFRQLCHKLASPDTANGAATSIDENTHPTKWSDTWIFIDIKVDAN